jgi:DNA-binding transcriptional ArsR family regulator
MVKEHGVEGRIMPPRGHRSDGSDVDPERSGESKRRGEGEGKRRGGGGRRRRRDGDDCRGHREDCDGEGRGRRRRRRKARGERLRDESGKFAEAATPEEVLETFEAVRGPVVTSSDVAELFNITAESARQKLSTLYEAGAVDRRKSGRTTVYWRTGEE